MQRSSLRQEAPHTLHGTRGDTVEADVQLTFTCWHTSTKGYLLANTQLANNDTEKFTATSEIFKKCLDPVPLGKKDQG